MKKLLIAIVFFVMMFGSINVFAEQTDPEYNTCISGDVVLNLNDDWQPSFELAIQHMLIPPDVTYIQVYANVHITGNTDADSLIVESAEFPSLTENIEIDDNGNFDQEVKIVLTGFSSGESDTINFGAYVNAKKGDKTVRVKIGKGKLNTDFLKNANNLIDQDSDGIINSRDLALLKQNLLAEYDEMGEQESINAYIYNEWYLKDFVPGDNGASFIAQTHLRAKIDATGITLGITNNGNTKTYEYSPSITGNTDQIVEFEGVVPLTQSSDIAASASIKAYKGNRDIELLSNLRARDSGNAIVGDLDGNNKVNSLDFMLMRKYIMGLIDRFPVESGFYCADVDDSKQINAIDFAYVRKYLLGMISDFPKSSNNIIPSTPIPPTSTPATPTPGTGMVTVYKVGGIDVKKNPGVEITVEKSSSNKIWVSAVTECHGPLYADGWAKTYFSLSGSAENGVDYEKIDFGYFWRIVGSNIFTPTGDDNPKEGFYITPIDTGSEETKDVEIYFGSIGPSSKPDAIIHLTKNTSDQNTNNN